MIFSDFSAFVIFAFFTVPFWHMMMISVDAGHSVKRTSVLGLLTGLWISFTYFAVLTEFDERLLGPFSPARPIIYLGIASVSAYLARNWILGAGVSQHLLISLQLIRPIGMVFVYENFRGTLPGVFAHPAGWGDLLVGVLAAYVLWRYQGSPIPARWVIAVAVFGIMDFVSAFFFGFTSSATPVQLFAHDAPNQVIDFPLGLIPLLLVPYAVIAHILSLSQLARDKPTPRK